MPSPAPHLADGELRLHGFGPWVAGAHTTFGPYSPTAYEMLWIIDGSAITDSSDGVHELVPGSVFLTPRTVRNFYRWDPHRATHHAYISFSAPIRDDWPRHRRLPDDDIVLALFRHMIWLQTEEPEGWAEAAGAAFEYLLSAYVCGRSGTTRKAEGTASELLTRTIAAMQRIWRNTTLRSPSLSDLAAAVGVTPQHLCRVFANEVGVGPIAALRLVRIVNAARLLTQTNMSIGAIAYETGFGNEFHFSRVFKATAGVPPTTYRRDPRPLTGVPPGVRRLGSMVMGQSAPTGPFPIDAS